MAILFGIFQWLAGAYGSDLGGDPDEAAHAVTSLMVRDYIAQGISQSPLKFAEAYYTAWPKVALGHYPPGYYVVAATALGLRCDPAALIILQAVLAAGLGLVVFHAAVGRVGVWAAALAALLVAMLPEVVRTGSHVLSDLQVALLMMIAVMLWRRFLQQPSWKWALAFGGAAAFAILTKASAVSLAALPVGTVILTRRWDLVRRLAWWGSAAPVVLIAGPWMVLSTRYTAEGLARTTPAEFFVEAIHYYGEAIPRVLGWGTVFLLFLAMASEVRRQLAGARMESLRACLWTMLVATQLLMMVVPTGFSPRYVLPWWPAAVLLGVDAIFALPVNSRLRLPAWMGVVAWIWVSCLPIKTKHVSGFGTSVARVMHEPKLSNGGNWLVSSDPRGEGAVISAAAFAGGDRCSGGFRILRGSKELASSDWIGRDYELKFASDEALLAHLKENRVGWVFVDFSMPGEYLKAHETTLNTALTSPNSGWKLAWRQEVMRSDTGAGEMLVYQREP
ncbi:MAG: glycosyltransferase family 39 protein [Verrucomicrobiaceae bacterium]|nr:glycosyltransferase family 39 protein [Verrucomicrobiaceae bacterium]